MDSHLQDDYKVRLEIFEGPLDLLLYLIKKDEVDIYNIPIELITRQYMEYMQLMRMLDLNIAGEFLVMAATLMMIKSRMLLPVEERPELEEEEDDPRWELVRQLVEYKKFKDAACALQTMEIRQENIFGRGAEDLSVPPEPGAALGDITIFDLIAAFNEALKRIPVTAEIGEIYAERHTVADKIELIVQTLRVTDRVGFAELFTQAATRQEIVCTFLAVLELIRLRQIRARQDGVFSTIVLERAIPA
ncbi:MAG: segregation and condensation protein A [Kiritimatiellia bacterium]|jgi:segregation and condensation protein A